MMPDIRVNGEPMTKRDGLAAAGGVMILVGLGLLGVPWVLIGVGTALVLTSRLTWQSSTESDSEPGTDRPSPAADSARG